MLGSRAYQKIWMGSGEMGDWKERGRRWLDGEMCEMIVGAGGRWRDYCTPTPTYLITTVEP